MLAEPVPPRTLLDELLAEQQNLQTPVARFSARLPAAAGASGAPLYRDLIPLTAPGPGERYAFQVDLDACTGCKACVAACHSLNGLDEGETWRDAGLLVNDDDRRPFTQTVTTACHHCEEPACLHGCPVLAYEQDPATGIVRHLDDQCIGCSYCILKCPYDAPKYNPRRGIVRKCDLCHGRLSEGEAPACAQACPTQAIRIVTVPAGANAEFLPGAPPPDYTRPTTRYLTKRALRGGVHAADLHELKIQPAHWPLVFMLLCTQASLGCFAAAAVLRAPPLALNGWLLGALGLAASGLHLGQPLKAWRVFLGLRRSWLSREIVVFAAWFVCATVCAEPAVFPAPAPFAAPPQWRMVALLGLGGAGVFCSAMVYADTRRRFWRLPVAAGKFFGSTALFGFAAAWVTRPASAPLAVALAAVSAVKLAFEARTFRCLGEEAFTPARKTALLLAGPLRRLTAARFVCGALGGLLIPLLALGNGGAGSGPAWIGFGLVAAAELAERALFFQAVDAPKMPGGPAG